jgi:serine/threonine protein kinase
MRYKCENCSAVNVMAANDEGGEVACGRCKQMLVIPNSSLAPGVVYGDFAIEETMVKRSQETDYKATQLSLNRTVVLKIVDDALSGNQEYAKLFVNASRKASTLSHPFLCQTIGVGRENGKYYLAREVGGEQSLRDLLVKEGAIEWTRAARMACDLAQALDYAWTVGELAHFNVKPDYVVVCGDDHARLADVGLAGINPDPESDRIIGTPQYISPERIVGLDGDTRSDLYSLGVTLFYMVTGDSPFDANSSSEFIDCHLNCTPRNARSLAPDLPGTLCDVLTVLMNKNPNMRYQTGARLVSDLQAVLAGSAPTFAVQSLRAEGLQVSDDQVTVTTETITPPKPKTAIPADDDSQTSSAIGQHVSPDAQFDDLDNLFDGLESELENETKSLKPTFSMPTDEFDSIVDELDFDLSEDDATAMPIAQISNPLDDGDDDDIPMVKPIAQAAPVEPVAEQDYCEDAGLADEVDALFDEPRADVQPVSSFPAMGAKQGRQASSPPRPKKKTLTSQKKRTLTSQKKKTLTGQKKKKLNTRMGTKAGMKIRKK